MPKFSTILSVYNGLPFLEEAIHSVLNQTFTDLELIIVDDGSEDGSGELSKKFAKRDTRVQLLLKNHTGLSNSLNLGLNLAKGEYIARIDSDDKWHPEKLESQFEFLSNNKAIQLLGCSVRIIDSFGNTDSDMQVFNRNNQLTSPALLKEIIRNNVLCSSGIVYAANLLKTVGYYNLDYKTSMDYEYSIRILSAYPGYVLKKVLLDYRMHKGMMSMKKRNEMILESIKIRKRARRQLATTVWEKLMIQKDIISLRLNKSFHQ